MMMGKSDMTSGLNAVLIAGPTASGKSSLAVQLAQMVDGVVINADSMQIYSDMMILSARPTAEEMGDIEHRLYGYVPPSERYSVGRWLDDAVATIKEVRANGQCPILVGGTGLYFKALLEGLNVMPDVDPAVRDHWAVEAERLGEPEALHALLVEKDPEMAATLQPADAQRVLRALEVLDSTGKSLLEWQRSEAHRQDVSLVQDAVKLVLCPPRETIYAKIEARFDQMVELGGIEEAVHLSSMGLDPELPAMKAIGVSLLTRHQQGEFDYEEAIRLCKRDTRRYAKRQMTWIRNQMGNWSQFEAADAAIAHFLTDLQKNQVGN